MPKQLLVSRWQSTKNRLAGLDQRLAEWYRQGKQLSENLSRRPGNAAPTPNKPDIPARPQTEQVSKM
ncbi:unnamed protein product [Protopolystoma xenopodis]|uniref:Uncharacterized protein n=1 Tax=Protopolystoma xenopodis TaxID=117903 RepID=A0A3S5CFA8_9PLAT|nr:unnamed protein product [Protopolystoma xenopodis]